MNPLISFFSLLFLLSVSHISRAAPCRNLIANTCKTISDENPNINFKFCTTSLSPAPASRCASLRGLAAATIRLTGYNLTDTRCHIKQLIKNTKNKFDPFEKNCLKDCFELYSNAIPSVKGALKYFNKKKYGDVNVMVSGVLDAAVTCEDGFNGREGLVSPLTKRNKDTFELAAMTLSVLYLVEQNWS
ncbi:hypothetical protein LguiA_019341 [Lonicera macranthoides]